MLLGSALNIFLLYWLVLAHCTQFVGIYDLASKKDGISTRGGKKVTHKKTSVFPAIFQNSEFKMLFSLFITWCPDGRICNSGEPLLMLASPEFGKHSNLIHCAFFCVKTLFVFTSYYEPYFVKILAWIPKDLTNSAYVRFINCSMI